MIVFRMLFNLFGILTRAGVGLLAFPLFILTRHLFLTVILVAAFILYLYANSDEQAVRESGNRNPATITRDAQGNKLQVATPVKRVEDGNSAFANDVYKQMTRPERSYYSQIFFWAMTHLPDGQAHSWSQIDIAGSITPSASFANKSGVRCRRFTETLKVHAVQQNLSGIACDNGGGTWCKLPANATPACGLGHKPSFMDSVGGAFGKMF